MQVANFGWWVMSTEHATGAAPGVLTAAMASLCIVNGVIRESFLCLYLTLPRYRFDFLHGL